MPKLLTRWHETLVRTRGVVMGLASFKAVEGTMTWVGVGNVRGLLLRATGGRDESLLTRGGVVGY